MYNIDYDQEVDEWSWYRRDDLRRCSVCFKNTEDEVVVRCAMCRTLTCIACMSYKVMCPCCFRTD